MLLELNEILKKYKIGFFNFKDRGIYSASHSEYDYLKADKYELRSILVFQEDLPKYSLKHLYDIRKEKNISILDEKVNRSLYDNNNSLTKQWENILAKKKIKRTDKDYYKMMDVEIAKTKKKLLKQLYPEVMNTEAFFKLLETDSALEDKSDYIINKKVKQYLNIAGNAEKIDKKIKRGRINTIYTRTFKNQVSSELNDILGTGYNRWKQIYVIIDHEAKTVEYFTGTSTGSGSRYMHGFGAHLLSVLKADKEIKTDCLFFKANGEVKSFTEKYLVVLNQDTTGNYPLEQNESQEILKQSRLIKKAIDLEFDYFMATGERLMWSEK